MSTKILIISGWKKDISRLEPFLSAAKKLSLDLAISSFADVEFSSNDKRVFVDGVDVSNFDIVYLRMVGRRLEQATVLAQYAKKHSVKIIDSVYEKAYLMPATLSKAVEMNALIEAGVSVPATYFGSLEKISKACSSRISKACSSRISKACSIGIKEKGGKFLGWPLVIKGTQGRKAREVWLVNGEEEMGETVSRLEREEKEGKSFFAQSFVKAGQRDRVFVLGDRVLGGITRPTKWRKRFTQEGQEGRKEAIIPVPSKEAQLAVQAAKAVFFDIAGVDILVEDKTDKLYVIEVNAAPSWGALKKDTGVEVEEEILKYLAKLK